MRLQLDHASAMRGAGWPLCTVRTVSTVIDLQGHACEANASPAASSPGRTTGHKYMRVQEGCGLPTAGLQNPEQSQWQDKRLVQTGDSPEGLTTRGTNGILPSYNPTESRLGLTRSTVWRCACAGFRLAEGSWP